MTLVLFAAGCRQIAGIEKRNFGSDGEGDGGSGPVEHPTKAQCETYCGTLDRGCNEDTSEVYAYKKDTEYCQALCPKLALAEDDSLEGNTFECRADQAQRALAVAADRKEGATNCRAAGAGGNGKCGSNCEAYCDLYGQICAKEGPAPRNECLKECGMLRDDPSLDADKSFANNDADTVQCRLAHLGAAALSDADVHCTHAAIYVDDSTPCMTPTPRCEDHCNMLMKVCNDGNKMKQYDSETECVNVCKKGMTNNVPLMPPDEKQDKTHDTVACRRYHTYNSFLIGDSHCTHAGPTGDGHCSRICPAYCKMVKAACPTEFTQTFVNDDGCAKNCAGLIKIEKEEDQLDLGYNVTMGAEGGNTIQCRFYRTVKAFAKPSECAAAVGAAAPCAP